MAPPFTAVAVKVTGVPWQVAVVLAATDTAGVTAGVTAMITGADITSEGMAQATLLVSVQVTVSF